MKFQLDRAWLRLAGLLGRHPWRVLGILAVSVVGSLAVAARLEFDFTPQAIYRGNDDLVEYAERFKQTFGYDEAIILVLLQATGAGDVFEPPALQWQAEFAADLRAMPRVAQVESLATIEIPTTTLTGLELRPAIPKLPVTRRAADKARGLLATQPLIRTSMLSADDRLAAIPVFLDPAARDLTGMRKAVAAVQQAIAARPPPADYRVHLSGLPVLRVEIVDDLRDDLMRLMPLSGAVYFIVLAVMFRRVSGVLPPLVAVGVGMSWTLATFTLAHESLNVVSNVLPVLLVIIGVSSSIQIVSCYAEESLIFPTDRRKAAGAAIAKMAPACLLAGLTTAVGFASLCMARSVLLQRFGWQAAIGIGFQSISALVVLGALFPLFAPPRFADSRSGRAGWIAQVVGRTGGSVARHPWRMIAAAAAIALLAIWSGSHVPINSFAILETFPDKHPSVQTLRLVDDQLSGVMPLEISLEGDHPGLFQKPEVFHQVVEIEQAALEQPGVLAAQSYADLFRQVLGHWPGRRMSETDAELVPPGSAGRVRLERTAKFMQRFAGAFHYDDYLSADGRRARVRIRLREIGSQRTLALIADLEAQLQQVFPKGGPIKARLTGEAYVNAQALHSLIRDLYYSLLTASLVIFGLIAIEFRSLRVGLIAALPNLTPLAVTLGYMGLRGYDMNVGNVIVFTVSLGLADDSTIHFLYRFREELGSGGDVPGAVRRAFHSTGRAIVATSLVLLAGMAVLLLSNFIPTRRFAELTGVTILGNLLGVLLLLPACLVLFWKTGPATPDVTTPTLVSQEGIRG